MNGNGTDHLVTAVAERLAGRVERGRRAFRDRWNFFALLEWGRIFFGSGPVSVIARPDERAVMLRFHSDGRLEVDLYYRGPHGFQVSERGELEGPIPEQLPREELSGLVRELGPFTRLAFELHLIEFDTTYGRGTQEPDRIVAMVEVLCRLAASLEDLAGVQSGSDGPERVRRFR